ncbi:MAG: hypothetical protein O7F17_10660, partial [Planctomycetota bacterium]|nr:hypothetical protein [Planctomycetota bacterium]
MAGLTISAAAIAWYAFVAIERSVDRITTESVPSMAVSLRLANKSTEIAATAPALMASVDQEERISAQIKLEARSKELAGLMRDLKATGIEPETEANLIEIQEEIVRHLGELNAAVKEQLRLKVQRKRTSAEIAAAHGQLVQILEPLVDDAVFNLVISGENLTAQSTKAITDLVEGGIGTIQLLLTINAEANLAAGLLAEAANAADPVLIQPIRERFFAAAATVERSLTELPELVEKTKLQQALESLLVLGSGSDNIFDVRERELSEVDAARNLGGQISSSALLETKRKNMAAASRLAHDDLLEMLTPMVDDATFNLVISGEDLTAQSTRAITGLVEGGIGTIHLLLTVNAEANLAAGLLAEAANASDPVLIQPIRERFFAAAATVERSLTELPDLAERTKLQPAVEALLVLGSGRDAIFDVRERE